jgi:hypothetical protein
VFGGEADDAFGEFAGGVAVAMVEDQRVFLGANEIVEAGLP